MTQPNIYCTTCGGTYPLPHTCGQGKPVDTLPPIPKVISKSVADMSDQEIEQLRKELADRETRDLARMDAKEAVVSMMLSSAGQTVKQAILKGYYTPADVAKVVADCVEKENCG